MGGSSEPEIPSSRPQRRIITGAEEFENERRISELIDLIASGEALALIGAGVSIPAGYDSWPGFLGKLTDRARALNPGVEIDYAPVSPVEYLVRAEQIRDHITGVVGRDGFFDEIGRIFYRTDETIRRSLQPFHSELAGLPFRAFLTTNFDEVLEVSLDRIRPAAGRPTGVSIYNSPDRRIISPAVRSIADPGSIRHVLHLHGIYWSGSGIVLCGDDFRAAYGIPELAPGSATSERLRSPITPSNRRPTPLFMLTASLLATRRVVFIGFSLDDAYFTEVLQRVSDTLWEWGSSMHFAIMPIEALKATAQRLRAQELKMRMGVETVFCEVVDGDHSELYSLVSRIANEIDNRPIPLRASSESYAPGATEEPVRTAPQVPDWVNENNAAQLRRIGRNED
jgi:hypothetical protein